MIVIYLFIGIISFYFTVHFIEYLDLFWDWENCQFIFYLNNKEHVVTYDTVFVVMVVLYIGGFLVRLWLMVLTYYKLQIIEFLYIYRLYFLAGFLTILSYNCGVLFVDVIQLEDTGQELICIINQEKYTWCYAYGPFYEYKYVLMGYFVCCCCLCIVIGLDNFIRYIYLVVYRWLINYFNKK